MNTGYGMPSRRRVRGPLQTRSRPPSATFEDASSGSTAFQHIDASSSAMPPPSSTPSSKKRERSSTISRSASGSLPWSQMDPSSLTASASQHQLPSADFSFHASMGFPTSTSSASMASLASMPSSSSISSFASFQQHQTPMSASPASFRTATGADESSVSARNAFFSRGNRSSTAAPQQTCQVIQAPDTPDNPPRKRRRGLAGAIVDTALNAALYTGAAALTAYSLWSSWGQSADNEDQGHDPDDGPQADMGHVISPNKRSDASNGTWRSFPGTLDEAPPPYYEDHSSVGHAQQPFTPQSNAARMRKVFVSSRRNGRRPEFAGSKTLKPSTSRKALSGAFGSPAPMISPSMAPNPQHDLATAQGQVSDIAGKESVGALDHGEEQYEDEDDEEDEQDEMLSRFEAKMNALIAEGQAALNSTPVLQDSDLREIDAPSPTLGISTSSRPHGQHLSSRASQRFDTFDTPFSPPSTHQTLQAPSSSSPSLARSNSHPDQLASDIHRISYLPEPVKRTFATPTKGLRHSRSTFDFQASPSGRSSPFATGRSDSPSGTNSPSLRAARRVTDFGGVARANGASPQSRIPRSISRRSIVDPRP